MRDVSISPSRVKQCCLVPDVCFLFCVCAWKPVKLPVPGWQSDVLQFRKQCRWRSLSLPSESNVILRRCPSQKPSESLFFSAVRINTVYPLVLICLLLIALILMDVVYLNQNDFSNSLSNFCLSDRPSKCYIFCFSASKQ